MNGIKDGITGAADVALDVAKALWNALRGFFNDNLLRPIRDIEVFGQTPFGFVPLLPELHTGGIVGDVGATKSGALAANEVVAVLQKGEGVLPTKVMAQLPSGAFDALRSGNLGRFVPSGPALSGLGGGESFAFNVTVNPTPGMTPEEARAVGSGVVDGAMDKIEALRLVRRA